MINNEFGETVRNFIADKKKPIINPQAYNDEEREYAELIRLLMTEIQKIDSERENDIKEAQRLQKRAEAFLKDNPQGCSSRRPSPSAGMSRP